VISMAVPCSFIAIFGRINPALAQIVG